MHGHERCAENYKFNDNELHAWRDEEFGENKRGIFELVEPWEVMKA